MIKCKDCAYWLIEYPRANPTAYRAAVAGLAEIEQPKGEQG